jgi:Flp pilus assembly protein TadD
LNVSRTKLVVVSLAVFAATLWLHWPCVNGEFLDVDDKEYLQQAASWNGLTWTAVKGAFTNTQHYHHPLPRLSHALDYQLWGMNAAGHHVASVVLHALNAVLVLGFVWTLLGAVSLTTSERLAVAAGVAIVFGIHPLQVESVAWIAGRTQLLCATFGILCLWVYITAGPLWIVWGLFVLALLSKPTAVSLLFVMLALDYYPLRRCQRLGRRRLVWEKAPMFALAVVAAAAAVITESSAIPWKMASLGDRVLMTFQSLVYYPYRLVFPWHIAPFYPLQARPRLLEWKVIVSALSVGVITAIAVWSRQRIPALVAGWGAYIVLVLPVSGLTQGLGAVAPRHAYVAMLPLLLLAGGAVVWLWRRSKPVARLALTGLLAGELCIFAAGTRSLIPDWHSEETLRRAVVRSFPDSEYDNRVLALVLLDQGHAAEALQYATRAVELAPQQCHAHRALASVLRRLGRQQEAMAEDIQALQLDPRSAQAHYNFGVALVDYGKLPEAVDQFQQALSIQPDMPLAHDNLGSALYQMGRLPAAIEQFEAELKINPDFAEAHSNLGIALAQTGHIQDAITHLQRALQTSPDSVPVLYNLGLALAQTGRFTEAIARFEHVLRLKPDYAEAHNYLGLALAQMGRIQEATAHCRQALRLKPDYVEAHYNLGLDLEQAGQVTGAIDQYQQALKLQPDFAAAKNALARLQTGQ